MKKILVFLVIGIMFCSISLCSAAAPGTTQGPDTDGDGVRDGDDDYPRDPNRN